MNVLALDPAKNITGYGIVIDGKLVEYGTIKTPKYKPLYYFYKHLDALIEKYDINIITKENAFQGPNIKTGMILQGIHGIIQLLSEKHDIPLFGYSVAKIKKNATGGIKNTNEDGTKKTAKQKKEEVRSAVNKYFNTNINNLDSSDALSVYICAVKEGDVK